MVYTSYVELMTFSFIDYNPDRVRCLPRLFTMWCSEDFAALSGKKISQNLRELFDSLKHTEMLLFLSDSHTT